MDEQLQQALTQFLQQVLSVKDFVMAETPDLIKQLLV